ncbi:MAG: 16S rRNA (adenine(1518)-N(6)/adenine(1519)-N(6))-dimethyltransferase RsmA [Cyclobacteriaceae bacterium]|nr:16S rRNA (adenine(1518)-N(6)/adenine(1519)-N(6))-dimethyltransferase RsmA [Cyclobacteriaceae bacterium]MCH8516323.1 16S rRNA (adenine(1518)-N(6)/adenine(1519)-N(6))-dimethyltransferase RsmA [Cyclobacteriaceae bacterium]
MHPVKAKKHLGQHFLKDETVSERIATSISFHQSAKCLIEVGPGTGALSKHLLKLNYEKLLLMEVDKESIAYLIKNYDAFTKENVIEQDFLQVPIEKLWPDVPSLIVVGNFPYNISSQIFFKTLEHKDRIVEVVGMLQKEVARRICSPPGSKEYGILSVLLQAWYEVEYLFEVPPTAFIPPPKVDSAVIRLRRKDNINLGCDEKLMKQVVKMAFNQRRKTLRNALGAYAKPMQEQEIAYDWFQKRAEQLSWQDFVKVTLDIEKFIST